jgi:prepilin-type N-terminal cleavage/methylation domain-containing protein
MVTRASHADDSGFTLLEVMVALVLGMIGLIGTVAVQQALLRATQNSNDAMIAMRLASQRMEQFNVSKTSNGPPVIDELAARATETGTVWSTAEYLDANGGCPTGTATWTGMCRWRRQWKVLNVGIGQPYDISVQVTYSLDSGNPKVVRIDAERRKSF